MTFALLKHVARAVVGAARSGAKSVPELISEFLGRMADGIWDDWTKEKEKEERRAELEALAKATGQEVRDAVAEAVAGLADDVPAQVRRELEAYLSLVPPTVRQAMRRPADPTGTTVPATLTPRSSADLLALLPPRTSRFVPGDRPLAGVDRELVELLGIGGFGEVWKARNPRRPYAAPVALKFCLEPIAAGALPLLQREASLIDAATRGAPEPGVVALRETYLDADPPCLEYEYVDGGELTALMRDWHGSGSPPAPTQAAALIHQVARTLGRFHRLDPPLVHRDLKPANLLVAGRTPDGSPALKVADFGIGGLTAARAIEQTRRGFAGRPSFLATSLRGSHTPLYASPEQMRGEPPDPRDDVYALGVVWYQLLLADPTAGAPTGLDWPDDLHARGMTPEQVALLAACLSRPDRRPPDAAAVADRIEGLFTTIGQAVEASGARTQEARLVAASPPQSNAPPRPRRRFLRALAVLAWALSAFVGLMLFQISMDAFYSIKQRYRAIHGAEPGILSENALIGPTIFLVGVGLTALNLRLLLAGNRPRRARGLAIAISTAVLGMGLLGFLGFWLGSYFAGPGRHTNGMGMAVALFGLAAMCYSIPRSKAAAARSAQPRTFRALVGRAVGVLCWMLSVLFGLLLLDLAIAAWIDVSDSGLGRGALIVGASLLIGMTTTLANLALLLEGAQSRKSTALETVIGGGVAALGVLGCWWMTVFDLPPSVKAKQNPVAWIVAAFGAAICGHALSRLLTPQRPGSTTSRDLDQRRRSRVLIAVLIGLILATAILAVVFGRGEEASAIIQ